MFHVLVLRLGHGFNDHEDTSSFQEIFFWASRHAHTQMYRALPYVSWVNRGVSATSLSPRREDLCGFLCYWKHGNTTMLLPDVGVDMTLLTVTYFRSPRDQNGNIAI